MNEEVIDVLKDFSNAKRYHYNRVLLKLYSSTSFVVTKGFRAVINMMNGGTCMKISIVGPEGVGKSMALAAIATLLHNRIPCFCWTPAIKLDDGFKKYVQDFFMEVNSITGSKYSF